MDTLLTVLCSTSAASRTGTSDRAISSSADVHLRAV